MNDYNARIIAALNGERVAETAGGDASHRALNGLPSMTQEAKDRAMVRLWGAGGVEVTGKGARQSDDYLAQLGMESAKTALRNRLLQADPKLTAGAADVRVEVTVEAAYVAAEHHKYEADRLASVTEALKAQAPKRIRESAAGFLTIVNESATAIAPSKSGRMTVRIINEGQGSSGTYPAATLEAAAKNKVFAKGLHMNIDHASATEDFDRPEGSLRNLAGVLETDAVYSNGALTAEATIFPHWRDSLTAMAPHIGVSIRANAEKDGDTVTRIVNAVSVDFVTRAGRGGAILSVNENKR